MKRSARQGLDAEGITVSISKLCKWFDVPRRTVYYKPVKAAPKIQARFVITHLYYPDSLAPILTAIEFYPHDTRVLRKR